jgi:hypothetical protein
VNKQEFSASSWRPNQGYGSYCKNYIAYIKRINKMQSFFMLSAAVYIVITEL